MQHEYVNEQGETVQWAFDGVLELQDLCEGRIDHGTEVWSRLFYESQVTDPDTVESMKKQTTIESVQSHVNDQETTQSPNQPATTH